jgi:hypothetical protein
MPASEFEPVVPGSEPPLDPRLRPRDHRDQPQGIYSVQIFFAVLFIIYIDLIDLKMLRHTA